MKSVEAKNFYFALADDWKRYKEVNKKLDGLVSNKKKFFRTGMEIYRNEFLFEEEILKKYYDSVRHVKRLIANNGEWV